MKKNIPYNSASIIESLPSKESKEILMRILASSSESENLKRNKRPRCRIESYRKISSDEDSCAEDDDRDEEFILEKEYSSMSESDSTSTIQIKRKRRKTSTDIMENDYSTKPRIDIKNALYALQESLSQLSHSVATLQQEFNELREFPTLSSSITPEIVENQTSFPMGCDDITFSLNVDSVTIPIRDREKVAIIDKMLQNDGIFSQAVSKSI